jgi:hypothetical protein
LEPAQEQAVALFSLLLSLVVFPEVTFPSSWCVFLGLIDQAFLGLIDQPLLALILLAYDAYCVQTLGEGVWVGGVGSRNAAQQRFEA